jgi:hypothetical protein
MTSLKLAPAILKEYTIVVAFIKEQTNKVIVLLIIHALLVF